MANNHIIYDLGATGFVVLDDDIALPNITTQAGAYPVKGETARVIKASAGSSLILPSILSGGGAPITFIINDSSQAVAVFCAAGEKMDGSTNGSRSVAAGAAGVFFRVANALGGPDIRSNTIV